VPGRAAVARRVEAAHEFEAANPKAEADLGCREVRNVDNCAALPESLHPGDGS